MTPRPDRPSPDGRDTRAAGLIAAGFEAYRLRFDEITARAPVRFESLDWRGIHDDAVARRDLYGASVAEVLAELGSLLGDDLEDRDLWAAMRARYADLVASRPDVEIAGSFFNSVTRRIFDTVGVDPAIEFVSDELPDRPAEVHSLTGTASDIVAGMIDRARFHSGWKHQRGDIDLAAAALVERAARIGGIERVDLLAPVFFRGRGAYLIGRIVGRTGTMPLALAVHHTGQGLVIGAVLTGVGDMSVLFSYTRNAFLADIAAPSTAVGFLRDLMPHKPVGEMYTLLGHHKHAKTELYRALLRRVEESEARFTFAPGVKGMVMIVFTTADLNMVLKVIRDRFPPPKQTTRRRIKAKYRLVARHDRAGRLVEAHEFEHLRFPREQFEPELLAELETEASRAVTVGDDHVVLHHCYVERQVVPLDLYVRDENPIKARAALLDFGRAIKNLAASDIFPGDMLLKNFGVTRNGRVVFYDYDELTTVGECRFRDLPRPENDDQALAADPWFGVDDNDIFPEQFRQFLGVKPELRELFEEHHADLFTARFWQRVQERVTRGEVIEIFPYGRDRRLRKT